MTKGLSTGLADSPARSLVRWPGILPVAILAGLAVLPAYAAADPATQPGAKGLYLAQATPDTGQPAGEEAAAGENAPAESPPAVSPVEAEEPTAGEVESAAEPAQEPAAEAAETPAAEPPAEPAAEPAAEAAEMPAAEPAQEPDAEAAEMPAAQEPAAEAAEMPAAEPPAEETETVSQQPPVEGLPGYPPILRKDTDMPEPVRKTWAAIRDAARLGDIEALQPLIEAQPMPPTFAFDEIDKPILYLKSLSGDPEGREILAILLEVLESGFVLADPDTPEAMYLWPYFSRYPLEKLTPEQMVEMFTLLTAGDYQDMLSYGAYIFFRVGISPDGTWHFFVAGD